MDEPGAPVFQAFCTACKSEIEVSILEPLDSFACKRCLTIQSFGPNQVLPEFVDPVPRMVMVAMLLLQAAVNGLALWRLHRIAGSVGPIPMVAAATMLASVVFFLRVKSPPLNAGFAMLSISITLASIAMRGYPVQREGAAPGWPAVLGATGTSAEGAAPGRPSVPGAPGMAVEGALEEWTLLVFFLAAILSLGLVFMVGELLRISRLPRA